jgi:hypothetical protein
VFNRGAVQLTQHMQGISAGDAVQGCCENLDDPAWRQSTEVDDGATWVMEVRRDKLYRMITRGNIPDSKLEEAMRKLLGVAKVAVSDEMQ